MGVALHDNVVVLDNVYVVLVDIVSTADSTREEKGRPCVEQDSYRVWDYAHLLGDTEMKKPRYYLGHVGRVCVQSAESDLH